jgi:hypothetical protein
MFRFAKPLLAMVIGIALFTPGILMATKDQWGSAVPKQFEFMALNATATLAGACPGTLGNGTCANPEPMSSRQGKAKALPLLVFGVCFMGASLVSAGVMARGG